MQIGIKHDLQSTYQILGVAMATGHYRDVQQWAVMEFVKSPKTPIIFLGRRQEWESERFRRNDKKKKGTYEIS